MISRATASTSRPVGPGRTAASASSCARRTSVVDLAVARRRARRWRTSACSPRRSRRAGAPQSIDDERAGRDRDVARRGVRQRAVLAGGDDRRERRPPRRRGGASRTRGRARRRAPCARRRPSPSTSVERLVGELRGGADRVELLGVLDRAQLLDHPARGDELDRRPATSSPSLPCCLTVRCASSKPTRSRPVGQAARQRLEQVLRDLVLPRVVDLLGGLREVAEVGDEAAAVGADRAPRRLEPVKPVSQRTLTRFVTRRTSSSRSASRRPARRSGGSRSEFRALRRRAPRGSRRRPCRRPSRRRGPRRRRPGATPRAPGRRRGGPRPRARAASSSASWIAHE